MNNYWLIFLGGGLGSLARYLVAINVSAILGKFFPYGVLVVNITGSFLMGVLSMIIIHKFAQFASPLTAFLLIGFLGGYTTFSAFSFETLVLFEQGKMLIAFANIFASVICCVFAVWVGVGLGKLIAQ